MLLGRARVRLGQGGLAALHDEDASDLPPLTARDRALVTRVAWAVAVAARVVPWRSDCMVQALAARSWLAGQGLETRLVLGVPKQRGARFEAHAWLVCGDLTVTGGNVTGYTAFRPA